MKSIHSHWKYILALCAIAVAAAALTQGEKTAPVEDEFALEAREIAAEAARTYRDDCRHNCKVEFKICMRDPDSYSCGPAGDWPTDEAGLADCLRGCEPEKEEPERCPTVGAMSAGNIDISKPFDGAIDWTGDTTNTWDLKANPYEVHTSEFMFELDDGKGNGRVVRRICSDGSVRQWNGTTTPECGS